MPFRHIEDPVKLRRLLEAVLLLEGELSLPVLLRHIVEEACSMAGARYGALGVLNDEGSALSEFITVGIDEEATERIGPRPTGKGVLGLLITEPRPLRLTDLNEHPNGFGFPPNHPPMKSFLGVPVSCRDEVYGNLYLTDKIGWSEFTSDDEDLVRALAQAAGIAIESARLHQRVQDTALFEDRDRIARDLHDAVIQRLFAVGLSLQGTSRALDNVPVPVAQDRLQQSITDINEVIRQIRTSIFELGSGPLEEGVRSAVLSLTRDLGTLLDIDVTVTFRGNVESITDDGVEHLLFTLREAVTNVGRHARATRAVVTLEVDDGACSLQIVDDGNGFDPENVRIGGLGVVNMRRRAEKLGGTLTIGRSSDGGTLLLWRVPNTPS